MKGTSRIGIIYAVSLGVAGSVAYFRGRRGYDLVREGAYYGLACGTAANLLVFVNLPKTKRVAEMKENFGAITSAGKTTLSKEGLRLLGKIDTSKLYADLREGGVKVAPLPLDPSIVIQDAT